LHRWRGEREQKDCRHLVTEQRLETAGILGDGSDPVVTCLQCRAQIDGLVLTEEVHLSGTSLKANELRELTWGWWMALLIGAVSIVAGVILILKSTDSLSALAVIFGIFMLIDGIVELIAALSGGTQSRGLLAVRGALCVIAGVLLIRHPLGGVKAVALLLGIWVIAAGMVRFVAAFSAPQHRVWRIWGPLFSRSSGS